MIITSEKAKMTLFYFERYSIYKKLKNRELATCASFFLLLYPLLQARELESKGTSGTAMKSSKEDFGPKSQLNMQGNVYLYTGGMCLQGEYVLHTNTYSSAYIINMGLRMSMG